jgi:uncharacterized membrane protein YebE (DUF533 family)
MFDAKKMLDQLMGAAENFAGKENIDKVKATVAANPGMAKAAGVGLAAVLLGTKSGRKVGAGALQLGGLAVVGGLAYQAYQNWQRSQGIGQGAPSGELAPPPADSPFAVEPATEQERAKAFIIAMIAAAKADGHIDSAEQKRIQGRMSDMSEDAEAKAFLLDEMMAENDIDRVARLARTPELAVEIYTASCLAIDLDHADERTWLDELATRLKLDPSLTEEIEAAVRRERATA